MPTEKYKYGWDDPRAGVKITDYDIEQKRKQLRKFMETKEKVMESNITSTLEERGKRYGTFQDQSVICQNLKYIMRNSPSSKWDDMSADQKECLDMIANKIGRILNGDPNYTDSWHDIQGYAKLVEDRINGIIK